MKITRYLFMIFVVISFSVIGYYKGYQKSYNREYRLSDYLAIMDKVHRDIRQKAYCKQAALEFQKYCQKKGLITLAFPIGGHWGAIAWCSDYKKVAFFDPLHNVYYTTLDGIPISLLRLYAEVNKNNEEIDEKDLNEIIKYWHRRQIKMVMQTHTSWYYRNLKKEDQRDLGPSTFKIPIEQLR